MTISVVVATYGDPYWSRLARRRAVPSICAQSVQPLEVIRRHGDTLASARNAGAADAAGDWLLFLDADDELHPEYLASMVPVIRVARDRPYLLVPAVQYIRDGVELRPGMLRPGQPMYKVNRCVIGTMLPRWLFREVGGFREWALYEDWDLWLQCLAAGATLVDIPDAIYRAHQGTNQESRNRATRDVQIETYEAIREDHRANMDVLLRS